MEITLNGNRFIPRTGHSGQEYPPAEGTDLNHSAREALCEWIQRNGLGTGCPGKIESCPECVVEIDALVSAFRNGIPGDLLWNPSGESTPFLFERLVKRLRDREGMHPLIALWTVESWAMALSRVAGREAFHA